MQKTKSLIAMSLLAGSLIIPSASAFADKDPPGNHRQRQELRDDMRRLEDLRRERDRARRHGNRHSARDYDEKIRDQRREIWQDRRDIYGQNRYRWDRDHWYRD